MSAHPKTPITRDELVRTNTAMLVLTSAFVLSRVTLQISKSRSFELSDFFIYLAFALFVSMWTCYLMAVPPMFRIFAVLGGLTKPYATVMQDTAAMLRFITAGQMCFYTLLFSVKMSLMTLYRKLLAGLPGAYKKIWWAIVSFCMIAWIGSVLSSVFTCNDLKTKLSQGKCVGTPDQEKRIIFSLYFAYSVDVATDLAIMFLPIRLTWNLQLPRKQKIGVFILFGSGFVCIAFATLRVVQLGVDGRGRATTPEPKWLLLWTVIECAMAVIIGCSPAFAILIRNRLNASKPSYNAQGYVKHGTKDIKMESIVSSSVRPRRDNLNPYWDDVHSSQEELAKNAGCIMVKTTVHQDGEISSDDLKHNSTGGSWTAEIHTGSGKVNGSTMRHS